MVGPFKCHGDDLLGAPSNDPGLVGVRGRLADAQILANIHNGKGRMPAFQRLTDADTSALLRFLGESQLFRDTVIYEMHVAGFTRHPTSGVGPANRGTYLGGHS